MPKDKRNALAELANEMSWIRYLLLTEGYTDYYPYANKAFLIIAELAKVENANDLVGLIGKCRAIAEE